MRRREGGHVGQFVVGELVERVAGAAPPASHGVVLDWLIARVGCDSAIFVPALDRTLRPVQRNKGAFLYLHGLYARDPRRYQPGLQRGHAALARDRLYVDLDVYSSRERCELPFYADIIRPQRISSQLVIAVDFHGRRRGTIHLCRHGSVRRFGSSLVDRLRSIVPVMGLIDAATSSSTSPPAMAVDPALGPREREVARLAGRGLETKEIAALLGTRPATVRNQLHAIFRKLDVSNRTELAFVLAGDPG